MGEYNKLAVRKIRTLEITQKINLNAYRLKLPSHIKMYDVFNVKHFVLYSGDSYDGDANRVELSSNPERMM